MPTTTPRWWTTTPRRRETTPTPTTAPATTNAITTTAAPKYADYQAVITYHAFKVVYVFFFVLAALVGEIKSRSEDKRDYRPHVADIVLLVLGAIGLSAFHLMSFFALARSGSGSGEDLRNSGCPLSVPPAFDDLTPLRVLLGFDATLNILLVVFQTTFLLTATCQTQREGALNTLYNLLVFFNLFLWINGSFLEVQSAPTTTCWLSPVQRVAFVRYWNKLVHLFYPLFMLYWLQALVMTVNLRLKTLVPSPQDAGRVQPLVLSPPRAGRLQPLGVQPEQGATMHAGRLQSLGVQPAQGATMQMNSLS
ncbi:Hypp1647 [Branchiostoma lanceolatum]|uniref:Hypp1647 protein n=1 Tax=Branchiostoma lanceolatum TaxID=7740 RepID=A0A8J9ZMX4_BRALA|nr:Hypp1647 [Branchiostoma lanceolatum]